MKEKNDMEQNKYIEVTIELGEAVKPHIWTAQNGQKMLTFQVAPRKNGADEKGRTHNASIRYKATDGNYYTQYIGHGKEKTFGQRANGAVPPPPAPRQSAPSNPVVAAGAAAAMSQRQNVEAPSAPTAGTTPFGDKENDPLPF